MKELIKKILSVKTRRKILAFLNHCWIALCYRLPVKDRVLFYTIRENGGLLENAKAVYDSTDCKKIIFAHKLPHSNITKALGYYYVMTSKVIVTDDYCRYVRIIKLKENQKLVQIWHAAGAFKMFGLDAPTDLSDAEELSCHSQYSVVAVTGEGCRDAFAGAFGISKDICLPLGLPRTDILINNPEKLKNDFLAKHPGLKNKTIYLYAPTFREKNGSKIHLETGIDWKKLSTLLKENELFIIRRHPLMDYNLTDGDYTNIIDMTSESTLALTSVSSVIVTDYSSVIYDAALLGVPSLFYCPDLDSFERSFYLKFPDDLPGNLITDGDKLPDALRDTVLNPPLEKTEKFIKEQLSACDGHSTERISALIKEYMNS